MFIRSFVRSLARQVKDAFTSLTGASKPHHVVDSNGVTLGYSHFGMLAAARWLKGELEGAFEEALRDTPGYGPLIIGHSLGGGAAAMLTMMLREQGGGCLKIDRPAHGRAATVGVLVG